MSLINVDAKIGSKAMAKRLEEEQRKLIHFNQCAYVKDRSAFDGLRTNENIMHYYTALNTTPGLMIAVDFEKAFESINWTFLWKTLRSFGFGPSFIKRVQTFYCEICSCVRNNGFSSGYFKLIRERVRQGDPLSVYLFILVIEVLAIQI